MYDWSDAVELALILVNAAALSYGGIVDYRKREIPNTVPIALLVTGILAFSGLSSIMGLVIPLILMLATTGISKKDVPGGDFKLLCSLGFAAGIWEMAATLLLAGVLSIIYGLIRRLPIRRNVPLCTYVALAYVILQITLFITGMTFSFK